MPRSDPSPFFVTRPADWPRVLETALAAPVVAVDVEGNGLFAYRAQLCTIQLCWTAGEEANVAIVDALAVDPAPLAELFGAAGPPKVLHDLTFDARLLWEGANLTLTGVRDTSVTARMLGRKATGLASLLLSELGIAIPKGLQQHDWSRRPIGPAETSYLATDVLHLAALDDRLSDHAKMLGIEDEIAEECAYKLGTALAPPRDQRPPYLRIKGVEELDAAGIAMLRRLAEERERIAMTRDQPPFKVADNAFLLQIARRKVTAANALATLKGAPNPRGGGARVFFERLAEAARIGLCEGEVPKEERPEPKRWSREAGAQRRAREARLSAWRRAEAALRGVDEQVVLPGHCLQDLADLTEADPVSLAAVAGLGARRVLRYATVLAQLVRGDPAASALPEAPGEGGPEAGECDILRR